MISLLWFSLCKIARNCELLFFRDLKLFMSSVRAGPFPQHLSCCTNTVTFNNLFRLFGSKLLWIYLHRKHLREPTQKSINEQLLTSLTHSQTCIPEKHILGIRIEGINILCDFEVKESVPAYLMLSVKYLYHEKVTQWQDKWTSSTCSSGSCTYPDRPC